MKKKSENKFKAGLFLVGLLCLSLGVLGQYRHDIRSTFGNHTVNGKELPIYCVETEKKQVAISFDCAWGNEETAHLLEILEDHDIKATFFMTGGWVESYPDDVKAIYEAGHDLGNHSQNHKNMSQLSDQECRSELMSVHDQVKELTGYDMFLFRPPYGDYDSEVIRKAQECGYYSIQWDVDSLDWKDYGTDAVIKTVCQHKHLGNGSIILMHNGAKYTADALDTLIENLQEQGYEIVPISELILKDHYHINVEGRQIPDEGVGKGSEKGEEKGAEKGAGKSKQKED